MRVCLIHITQKFREFSQVSGSSSVEAFVAQQRELVLYS